MTASVELDVPPPLRDCFLHSETICVRECCGIDAISDDPELVAEWGRIVGCQVVQQAIAQVCMLIAQVEDRSQKVCSSSLNAGADSDITRGKLLSFLQAVKAALGNPPMNKVLTRAEMEAQFDGEWVIVADPEAVYQEGIDQELQHWASPYFGPMPEASVLLNIWA